jgi:hypothetical protein
VSKKSLGSFISQNFCEKAVKQFLYVFNEDRKSQKVVFRQTAIFITEVKWKETIETDGLW